MQRCEIIFGNEIWKRDDELEEKKRKSVNAHKIIKRLRTETGFHIPDDISWGHLSQTFKEDFSSLPEEYEELECSKCLNQVETKKDRVCKIYLLSKCLEGSVLHFKESRIEERKTSKKDMEGLDILPESGFWEVYLSMEGVSEKVGGRVSLKQECSRAKCECNDIKSLFVVKTPFRGRVFKYAKTPYIPIRFVCPPSRHNVSHYVLTIKLIQRPTGRMLLGECWIHFRSRNYKKRIAATHTEFAFKQEIPCEDSFSSDENSCPNLTQEEIVESLNGTFSNDSPFRHILEPPSTIQEIPTSAPQDLKNLIDGNVLTDEEEMVLQDFFQICL